MAKRNISVLVCDICGEQMKSDDITEELGTYLRTFEFTHFGGGFGRARKQIFICYQCGETPLNDLMLDIQARNI